MAKYARLGRVRVVTCTGGERGDILNPLFDDAVLAGRTMAQLRREEMAAAARILGIEHVFLGFVDSGLPEGYPDAELPADSFARAADADVHRALVAQIREFRPQVVTTYDENGGYPHPDHLRTHTATLAAVRPAKMTMISIRKNLRTEQAWILPRSLATPRISHDDSRNWRCHRQPA
ncbi:PIG-L family deacetylase [Actinotignum timonense]|nr:PIG-L family deacetylase [Actinotignum timonense]